MGPPLFSVDLIPQTSYAIEITSDLKFFESDVQPQQEPQKDNLPTDTYFNSGWLRLDYDSKRPDLEFYAFALPPDVWRKLTKADRLYYRLVLLTPSNDKVSSPPVVLDLFGNEVEARNEGEGPFHEDEIVLALWPEG